jgi:hypothetical protein
MSARIQLGLNSALLLGGAMRHFRIGLVTLIASAAVLVPAGLANATQQNGLVNVTVTDVANGNQTTVLQQVAIPVAANICGIQASALSAALLQGQAVVCTALTNSTQTGAITWI